MVSDKKKTFVQKLVEQLKAYPVIALVNMQNLPAKQLQNMRAQLLKKDVIITMARKRLLQLALKNSQKENITQLIEKIKGMPALLLSKENPFLLYSILQKNKSPAPAKANQIAPKDVVVLAGPTTFAPGPIISELGSVGIKTKVDGGKLTIVSNVVVAKEGDTISQKLAEMLKRLDIQPMEIGLDLVAAWEKGTVFNAKQLFIDEAEYTQNIIRAFQEAFNLSVEAVYPTQDNIELLLQKAFQDSKGLALEQNILTDATTEAILAKTEAQANALKTEANIETSAAPKPKEEVTKKPVEIPAEESQEEAAPTEETPAPKKEEEPKEEETPAPKEEPKEEETPAPKKEEEPKEEETPAPKKEEEPKEEETPAPKKEKEPKEEETPAPKKEEEPKEEETPAPKEEETPTEEAPQPEPQPTPEPTPKPQPIPNPKTEEDIPSATDLIQQTKAKFAQVPTEKKSEVITEKISAESLVDAELAKAEEEKPKKAPEVEEGEALFEKLKKQGTLRKEDS